MMTEMFLSDDDRDKLRKALDARTPEVVQARMANALLLLAEGLSVEDVAGLLYLPEETVAGWRKLFARRGRQTAA